MILDEAISIIKKDYPGFKLVNAVDYDNYFVFNIMPPKHDIDRDGEWFGGLVAVDKLFKLTLSFNPLEYNSSEYMEATKNNITYF